MSVQVGWWGGERGLLGIWWQSNFYFGQTFTGARGGKLVGAKLPAGDEAMDNSRPSFTEEPYRPIMQQSHVIMTARQNNSALNICNVKCTYGKRIVRLTTCLMKSEVQQFDFVRSDTLSELKNMYEMRNPVNEVS